MRKKIQLHMSTQEVVATMSEGNPGGLRVLMDILKADPKEGVFDILSLDDMNIRGPQIWVGFKDYCDEDLEKFRKAIKARDPNMVRTINRECHGLEPAVTSGASFERTG